MVSKNVQNGDAGRPLFQYLPQVAPRWSRDVILELPRALLRPLCRHLEVLGSHFGPPNRLLGCPDGAQDIISELPGSSGDHFVVIFGLTWWQDSPQR